MLKKLKELIKVKSIETSKAVLIFVELLVLYIAILSTICVFMGLAEPITALVTGTFGLASMTFGFYFWKAKNENIRKYSKKISDDDAKRLISLWEAFKEDHTEDSDKWE